MKVEGKIFLRSYVLICHFRKAIQRTISLDGDDINAVNDKQEFNSTSKTFILTDFLLIDIRLKTTCKVTAKRRISTYGNERAIKEFFLLNLVCLMSQRHDD